MTGRRLLDVAAIFKASRGVAAKHVALRQNQVDIYSKTSSLAKAVKSQTDRVTLTVKAASVLAERFNGPESDHFRQSRKPPKDVSIPSQGGASGKAKEILRRDSLSQDHFYEKPDPISAAEPSLDGNFVVEQEKSRKYPLANGTNFPADTAEVPKQGTDSHSQWPQTDHVKFPSADGREGTDESPEPTSFGRTGIPNPAEGSEFATAEKPKKPHQQTEEQTPFQTAELPPAAYSEELALEANEDRDMLYTPSSPEGQGPPSDFKLSKDAGDAQKSDGHVPGVQISQDTFYSSSLKNEEQPVPQSQAVPEQDQNSDEAYTELFHSPRVARMLGIQSNPSKPSKGLEMSGARGTPTKQTKSPQEKDQVSSRIWTSGKVSPDEIQILPTGIVGSKPSQAEGNEDIHDLAANMAKDAEAMSADTSQVGLARDLSRTLVLID